MSSNEETPAAAAQEGGTPEKTAPAAKKKSPSSKKKESNWSRWRANASAKLSEVGADIKAASIAADAAIQAKMAEKKVGQKLDKLSERAQLSMKKAKEDMAKKRKVALRKPEDKMAKAWRQQCMMELQLGNARTRVFGHASAGFVEVETPMSTSVLDTLDRACTGAITEVSHAAELSASIAACGRLNAQVMQQLQEGVSHGGDTTEDTNTEALLAGCGMLDFAGWGKAIEDAVNTKSKAFAKLVSHELADTKRKMEVAQMDYEAGAKKLLSLKTGADESAVALAQASLDRRRRRFEQARVRYTATLLSTETQAKLLAAQQLTGVMKAHADFFRRGNSALVAMQDHAEALEKTCAEEMTAMQAVHDKLEAAHLAAQPKPSVVELGAAEEGEGETTQPEAEEGEAGAAEEERVETATTEPEPEPAAEPAEEDGEKDLVPTAVGAPPPANLQLTTNTEVFEGLKSGVPQKQGWLFHEGERVWCVLVDGKFHEYEDSFAGKPIGITSMFLCTARPPTEHKLRLGFELRSPTASVIYQAEDSAQAADWLSTIQKATEWMILNGGDASPKTKSRGDELCQLLREADPTNLLCADCDTPDPDWISINLGVLVCLECSGIHRGLGVQTSKVRSLTLDKVDDSTVALMKALGNSFANSIYEAKPPPSCAEGETALTKPTPHDDRSTKHAWIRAKYKERTFVDDGTNAGGVAHMTEAVAKKDVRALAARLGTSDSRDECTAALLSACEGEVDEETAEAQLLCVELLLHNGAVPAAAVDEENHSALHYAVAAKSAPLVKLLLSHDRDGASVRTQDADGKTALQIAQGFELGEASRFSDGLELLEKAEKSAAQAELMHQRGEAGKCIAEGDAILAKDKLDYDTAIEAWTRGLGFEPDSKELKSRIKQAEEKKLAAEKKAASGTTPRSTEE